MLCAIHSQDNHQDTNDNADYALSYEEPDLCNDYISKEQDNVDRFSINIPRHCVLGHILLDTNPLNEVDSWKKVVRPSKKPRNVDPRRSNPMHTVRKTTSNKKLRQNNTRSRSVTIQTHEDRNNKNKESRSDNTLGHIKPRSEYTPNNPISTISDLQELRSVDEDSTPKHMTSVTGHPKNRLYIDSGASLHILFNKELVGELQNIDKPLKIKAGGKSFHIKQIGSLYQALRHLPLPVTIYHYSETAIANLLLFAKLIDKYYIICNTTIDDAIYV